MFHFWTDPDFSYIVPVSVFDQVHKIPGIETSLLQPTPVYLGWFQIVFCALEHDVCNVRSLTSDIKAGKRANSFIWDQNLEDVQIGSELAFGDGTLALKIRLAILRVSEETCCSLPSL